MSDEEARKGLVICKTQRDLTASRIWVLESKLANSGPYYKGRTADRKKLRDDTELLVVQKRLIAAYESRLQQAQPARTQSMEAVEHLSPETGSTSANVNAPQRRIDKEAIQGEWIDRMVEEGKIATSMLRANMEPEEVRQKCPRFFAEVLDLLPEDQKVEFYRDARFRSVYVPQLLRLIGQVKNISDNTAATYRKRYRRKLPKQFLNPFQKQPKNNS
jgi:hypothetical protein